MLPEKHYFDTGTIRSLLNDRYFEHSESFVSTARAYRTLGFPWLWPEALAGPLSFMLSFAAVALGAQLARAAWRPAVFALLAIWTVPIAIFHGTYSKEAFAIVAIGVMARVARSGPGFALAAGVGMLYAIGFRTYWAVIVVLYVVLVAGWRMGLGWPTRLALVAVAIVPLSIASQTFAGMWLSDGRTVVVETREDNPDSSTMFLNPWPNSSPATDLANSIAGWLALILPFYLIKTAARSTSASRCSSSPTLRSSRESPPRSHAPGQASRRRPMSGKVHRQWPGASPTRSCRACSSPTSALLSSTRRTSRRC